jgi:hypothetical protein
MYSRLQATTDLNYEERSEVHTLLAAQAGTIGMLTFLKKLHLAK